MTYWRILILTVSKFKTHFDYSLRKEFAPSGEQGSKFITLSLAPIKEVLLNGEQTQLY